MRLLTLLIVFYAAVLLLTRDTIASYITIPGGVIWLDALIALLFAAAFGLFRGTGKGFTNGTLPVLLIGGTIFGAMQVNFSSPEPYAAFATAPRETTLHRAWDGHFRTIAKIEGADIGLMVDTGASLVLLRYDDAMRAGVDPDLLDFDIPLTTANGRSFVASYQFSQVRIGGVVVRNVQGAIAEPGALHSSLLGMSFIEQLSEAVIRKNTMILRQ